MNLLKDAVEVVHGLIPPWGLIDMIWITYVTFEYDRLVWPQKTLLGGQNSIYSRETGKRGAQLTLHHFSGREGAAYGFNPQNVGCYECSASNTDTGGGARDTFVLVVYPPSDAPLLVPKVTVVTILIVVVARHTSIRWNLDGKSATISGQRAHK